MEQPEIYWTVVGQSLQVTEIFMTGYCFYRLVKPFMEKRKGASGAGWAYILTMLALYVMPVHLIRLLPCSRTSYSMGTFAAFFVMCRMERKNYGQKAFLSMTFFFIHWIAFAAADILYDDLYRFAEETDYMAEHLDMWFALYAGVCLFNLLAELLFMSVGIWYILKACIYKHRDMTKKELLVMSVPSFTGMAGYVIIRYYRGFYIWETGSIPNAYDMLALMYYIVSVAAVIVVISLYQSIKAAQEEKLHNELLAAQMDSIRQHIGQVERLYQDIHSMKHDMANHIFTLERLYAGNNTEEARAYGMDLKAVLGQAAGEIKSGNPVTDVILQELKKEAEKKGIHFHSDFHYPADSNLNAFDVSVMLNNALQNAIENTIVSENPIAIENGMVTENTGGRRTPHISVFSYQNNNAYMIEVRNSFVGNLRWDGESGLPATTKQKTDGHGYGLSNIRKVAEKYFGGIDIVLKDEEFHLSIMLMLEQCH